MSNIQVECLRAVGTLYGQIVFNLQAGQTGADRTLLQPQIGMQLNKSIREFSVVPVGSSEYLLAGVSGASDQSMDVFVRTLDGTPLDGPLTVLGTWRVTGLLSNKFNV